MNDRTRSRRKLGGPVTCDTPHCGRITDGGSKRCDSCKDTIYRLKTMRPSELDEFERNSMVRLARLAIVRGMKATV